MRHLIIGGQRSGKSAFAQTLAMSRKKKITIIATARALDEEMQRRIEQHRQKRPKDWKIIEEPMDIGQAIENNGDGENCIIIDCLSLWLCNFIDGESFKAQQYDNLKDKLLLSMYGVSADLIFVSNESNMGVIPLDRVSRRYCDELGELHQAIAKMCDGVTLTVAGIPVRLKGGRN